MSTSGPVPRWYHELNPGGLPTPLEGNAARADIQLILQSGPERFGLSFDLDHDPDTIREEALRYVENFLNYALGAEA